jgi:Ca-activated chloride channel family protein
MKLTTMGIGSEFNEDLLIPLADLTGGNAYYIETPAQLPDAFRGELGSALRVSYRNVEIKLQLPAGVVLKRVHRVTPQLSDFDPGPEMDGSYALLLGDYDPSSPVSLLLELIVQPKSNGIYRLAQALLAWDDAGGDMARANQRQDVVVQVSNQSSTSLNARVMNIVEKVSAYRIGVQALAAAQGATQGMDEQELRSATVRLRQAATRLLDMGELSLADTMRRQAEILENHGDLDPEATKKLRYETRRLAQRS